jgi:hypothetical protein
LTSGAVVWLKISWRSRYPVLASIGAAVAATIGFAIFSNLYGFTMPTHPPHRRCHHSKHYQRRRRFTGRRTRSCFHRPDSFSEDNTAASRMAFRLSSLLDVDNRCIDPRSGDSPFARSGRSVTSHKLIGWTCSLDCARWDWLLTGCWPLVVGLADCGRPRSEQPQRG